MVLGAAAAVGLTRLLGNYLYRVSPRDPVVFGSAFVVMLAATLVACFCLHGAQHERIRYVRCASNDSQLCQLLDECLGLNLNGRGIPSVWGKIPRSGFLPRPACCLSRNTQLTRDRAPGRIPLA